MDQRDPAKEAQKLIAWATDHVLGLFQEHAQIVNDWQALRFGTLSTIVRERYYNPRHGWELTGTKDWMSAARRTGRREEAREWIEGLGLQECCEELELDVEWVRELIRRIPSVVCIFGWRYPDSREELRRKHAEQARNWRASRRQKELAGMEPISQVDHSSVQPKDPLQGEHPNKPTKPGSMTSRQ